MYFFLTLVWPTFSILIPTRVIWAGGEIVLRPFVRNGTMVVLKHGTPTSGVQKVLENGYYKISSEF